MNFKYRINNKTKNHQEKPTVPEFPKTLTTSLGNRGYSVLKKELTDAQQDAVKKMLLVKPVMMGNVFGGKEPAYPVYRESSKKIYMPRCFGESQFGAPKNVAIPPGDDIHVEFAGTLRENQVPVVETYINRLQAQQAERNELEQVQQASQAERNELEQVQQASQGGGLLELPCAYGKCLGKNTKILMYDGTIKNVQDIKVGEVIMGDDSTPRNILSLARGRETMYKVKSPTGEYYIVNESHILSLKRKRTFARFMSDKVVDISVTDYLRLCAEKTRKSNQFRKLKGYRVPITFPKKEVEIDPYLVGYWLGTTKFSKETMLEEYINITRYIYYHFITTKKEIGFFCKEIKTNEKEWMILNQKKVWDNFINEQNILETKTIPQHYKCNSREIQLELLAGIIDSCGFCELSHKQYILLFDNPHNKQLMDDILFVIRSLGFSGAKHTVRLEYGLSEAKSEANREAKSEAKSEQKTHYYLHISGDDLYEIPVKRLVNCFQKQQSLAKAYNHRKYRFQLEKLEEDDYYGFEIDGNRRFVLGDFTVTHNTTISLNIISRLQKKTLVIVHKEFLLNQWIERISQFLPTARVGKIQGQIIDIEDKDIVIGMLQSLSMKDYPETMFESFGLTIIDEVHHISSEVFSRALFKIVTRYMLGLSATMERKDGTTYVFKMFLGDVAFKGSRDEEHDVCVRAIQYKVDDAEFNETELDFRGNPKFSTMIVKLCSYNRRSDFIVRVLKDLLQEQPDKQIMVLSHNRSLLTYIYEAVTHYRIATIGYYVGGMKQTALQDTETKLIVLATYAMAAEALDIKTLSSLVMVTPKTDIVQSVGRILRVKHEKPIVVDIVDSHDIFQNQWAQRRRYYKKCNYRIRHIDSKSYTNMMIDWETDTTWKRVYEPKKTATSCDIVVNTGINVDNDDEDDDEDTPIKKPVGKCLISLDGLNL